MYSVVGLFDFMDGAVARITNHATQLGENLDMDIDSAGMIIATLLIVQYEQVPAWFLLVGFARYLFLIGLWFRQRFKLPVYDLLFSHRRRLLAGLMMGLVIALLLPMFAPPGTVLVALTFTLPFLIGFFLDWLRVCGRSLSLQPNSERWQV
jgi:CDP-diacylglycerol--glycerol-3-phosphate 3-phosphatidyltransferase